MKRFTSFSVKKSSINLLTAAMIATGSTGCALKPWSLVDGEGASRSNDNQYNVMVVAVDEQSYLDGRLQQKIEPGSHYLRLATTKRDFSGDVTVMPLFLKAEPCTRYVFFAEHDRRMTNKSWKLVLRKSEPIGGCKIPEAVGTGVVEEVAGNVEGVDSKQE